MPLRIVPSEATDAILLAVDRPVYRAEPRAMYREFVEARPNLTREQIVELTRTANKDEWHWQGTPEESAAGLTRKHISPETVQSLRDLDVAWMTRFLAAAFEQKVEG